MNGMEAWVLDEKYESIFVIDDYSTFIWTDRYKESGDFELHMPVNLQALNAIKLDRYIYITDTDRLMIIEEIHIDTTADEGNTARIVGRSLESLLDRRVVKERTTLKGSFQDAIEKLLNENVIKPTDKDRTIPNFSFKKSTDPKILDLKIDIQIFGDNLYDAVQSLCNEQDVGFRVLPKGEGGYEFELYYGIDRSAAQDERTIVVFSPEYENFISSAYSKTYKNYKSVGYAPYVSFDYTPPEGESVDYDNAPASFVQIDYDKSRLKGLDRREFFLDQGMSTYETPERIEDTEDPETGEIIPGDTDEEYAAKVAKAKKDFLDELAGKLKEDLAEYKETEMFTGEIEATRQFVYRRDFDIGDIVQVYNEYEMEFRTRVIEIIRCMDTNGYQCYPTFSAIEEKKEDDEDT